MNSMSHVGSEDGVNGLYKVSYSRGLLALGKGFSRKKLWVNAKRQVLGECLYPGEHHWCLDVTGGGAMEVHRCLNKDEINALTL